MPLALTGCASPLSTLDPAGPAAANIATLWWVMFWGATALFILVLAILAVALFRPSLIERVKPMHWIVGGGLIMPVPILLALLFAALLLGERLLPHREDAQPMRIEAHARQWEWRFRYPEHPTLGETGVLYLPSGEPIDIVATSEDVIHSFWVPRLGGKMDAIPGHANTIRLQADEPGMYRGVCAEYCGQGHETMSFAVQAFPSPEFMSLTGEAP
jgi:cytochrome c oxidase subunit 2